VSDMGTEDIADVLGMSADAVRHVQQRALRSLARSMDASARAQATPVALVRARGSHAAPAGSSAAARVS